MNKCSIVTGLRAGTSVAFVLALICFCAICFTSCYQTQLFNNSVENTYNDIEVVKCVRVVDGDTLIVNNNGKESKVRLIGVDTPESVSSDKSKNCIEGEIASNYTKSLITPKQELYLTKDVSNTDKYGRLLRFVWMEKPSETPTEDEIKTKMLNARLVYDGYAQAKKYEPDTKLSALFSDLEKHATENNLGVSYKWK